MLYFDSICVLCGLYLYSILILFTFYKNINMWIVFVLYFDFICVVSVFFPDDIWPGASHTGGSPQGRTMPTTQCPFDSNITYR